MSHTSTSICKATGKLAFASAGEAHATMRRVQVRHRGRYELCVYRCQFCQLWHHGRRRGPEFQVPRQ